jgi:cell division protein FtsZ
MLGIGSGTGSHRALDAAKMAISSPLFEYSIHNAQGVIFNVVGSDISLKEVLTVVLYCNNVF